MTAKATTEKQVVMARRVARRWISKVTRPEHRLKVLYGAVEIRNLPNLIRSFRDNKVAMEGLRAIPDLGIKENFDSLEVWSSDREGLVGLQGWFEKRGFETSGVW